MVHQEILKYLDERPALYAPSTAAFWTDDHISRQMLAAHLDLERDGASRRGEFIDRSAKWIAQLAVGGKKKRLLDLGCGPGLYAERLTDLGFRVTGIDISRRSISYARKSARQNNKKITYLNGDYLQLSEEARYDVAILIYCDFGTLCQSKRAELLKRVKRALKPGGFLVVDGYTMRFLDQFHEDQRTTFEMGGFWSPKTYGLVNRKLLYREKNVFLQQYVVFTADSCNCYNIWNRAFGMPSFIKELEQAGFSYISFYGDAAGKKVGKRDLELCAVAMTE